LSLYLDVDYYDLRERDYPLLAPSAMAERLRKVAELFPPSPGFEFAIFHKRRKQLPACQCLCAFCGESF